MSRFCWHLTRLNTVVVEGYIVDGNYRVEILYTFIRPNQEQLRKMHFFKKIFLNDFIGYSTKSTIKSLNTI